MINVNFAQLETPVEDWLYSNNNSGFFALHHIEHSMDSELYTDLWILTRNLTENEIIELEYT